MTHKEFLQTLETIDMKIDSNHYERILSIIGGYYYNMSKTMQNAYPKTSADFKRKASIIFDKLESIGYFDEY